MTIDLSLLLSIAGLVLGAISAWPQLRQIAVSFSNSRKEKKLARLEAQLADIRRLSQDAPYAISVVGMLLSGLLTSVLFILTVTEVTPVIPTTTLGVLMLTLRQIIFFVAGYISGRLFAAYRNVKNAPARIGVLEKRIKALKLQSDDK